MSRIALAMSVSIEQRTSARCNKRAGRCGRLPASSLNRAAHFRALQLDRR